MYYISVVWLKVGDFFKSRPMTIIGVVLGAMIFAGSLGVVLVRQETTNVKVKEIRNAFCNGENPNPQKCQKLFDALLKNPTPDQAKRLKEIVRQ